MTKILRVLGDITKVEWLQEFDEYCLKDNCTLYHLQQCTRMFGDLGFQYVKAPNI